MASVKSQPVQKKKDMLSQFVNFKTDRERLDFLMNNDHSIHTWFKGEHYSAKSADIANSLRTTGNVHYRKKNFVEAMNVYTKSIFHSPIIIQGEESHEPGIQSPLALGYANRSAVLFQIGYNDAALVDIERALKHGYSLEAQYKLLQRRAKIYLEKGEAEMATMAYQAALDSLKYWTGDTQPLRKIKQQLGKEMRKCASKPPTPSTSAPKSLDYGYGTIPTLTDQNEMYSSVSAKVEIAVHPDKGRYAVAAYDIDIGEIALVERPYAFVLSPEFPLSHCSHCGRRSNHLIPCLRCSNVGFCNEGCRSEAWQKYHKNECKYIGYFDSDDMYRVPHLTFRALLCTPHKDLLTFGKLSTNTKIGNLDLEEITHVDNPLLNLVSHNDSRPKRELLEFSKLAVKLSYLYHSAVLNHDVKVGDDAGNGTSLLDLGTACLHILGATTCNAFAVAEMTVPKASFQLAKPKDIGLSIYGAASMLFNHSCNPTAEAVFHGNTCVVRAVKNIGEGEEVSIDYGPVYYLNVWEDRQKTLGEVYHFECSCEACEGNWPVTEELGDQTPTFKCEHCNRPHEEFSTEFDHLDCLHCGNDVDVADMLTTLRDSHHAYSKAMKHMHKTVDLVLVLRLIPTLENYISVMDKWLCLPWKDYISCQGTLKQCYRLLGNYVYV